MKYTETHEWINASNGLAVVGITEYAQKELGDIVYVELPALNATVKAGQEVVVLESTKAAADVYAPVSGTIVEVNAKLKEASELINNSPETDGWLFKLKISNPSELDQLMDQKAYETMVHGK